MALIHCPWIFLAAHSPYWLQSLSIASKTNITCFVERCAYFCWNSYLLRLLALSATWSTGKYGCHGQAGWFAGWCRRALAKYVEMCAKAYNRMAKFLQWMSWGWWLRKANQILTFNNRSCNQQFNLFRYLERDIHSTYYANVRNWRLQHRFDWKCAIGHDLELNTATTGLKLSLNYWIGPNRGVSIILGEIRAHVI